MKAVMTLRPRRVGKNSPEPFNGDSYYSLGTKSCKHTKFCTKKCISSACGHQNKVPELGLDLPSLLHQRYQKCSLFTRLSRSVWVFTDEFQFQNFLSD